MKGCSAQLCHVLTYAARGAKPMQPIASPWRAGGSACAKSTASNASTAAAGARPTAVLVRHSSACVLVAFCAPAGASPATPLHSHCAGGGRASSSASRGTRGSRLSRPRLSLGPRQAARRRLAHPVWAWLACLRACAARARGRDSMPRPTRAPPRLGPLRASCSNQSLGC